MCHSKTIEIKNKATWWFWRIHDIHGTWWFILPTNIEDSSALQWWSILKRPPKSFRSVPVGWWCRNPSKYRCIHYDQGWFPIHVWLRIAFLQDWWVQPIPNNSEICMIVPNSGKKHVGKYKTSLKSSTRRYWRPFQPLEAPFVYPFAGLLHSAPSYLLEHLLHRNFFKAPMEIPVETSWPIFTAVASSLHPPLSQWIANTTRIR